MESVSHMLFLALYLMGGVMVLAGIGLGVYFWVLKRGGWHGN